MKISPALNDSPSPSPDSSPSATPHRRRPRYSGKNPRRFEEKYKERDPQRYAETVAKVLASGKTPAGTHRPIMVAEILEVLAPKPGEVAVDCTLGYGGHARELLARLQPGGRLLGLDADPMELPKTEVRLRAAGFGPETFTALRSNFAGLPQALAAYLSASPGSGAEALALVPAVCNRRPSATDAPDGSCKPPARGAGADCILADLGVSSMQLDDPERGFTYKDDGPLDLRMNPQRGRPASEWLSRVAPEALAAALRDNADEPMAGPLAEAMVASVRERPVTRTRDLARRLHDLYRERGWTRDKAEGDARVRRVFQALRIEVNDEFGVLESLLRQIPTCLKPGGRVAILTFHSGEDRRVKRAFLEGQRQGLYEVVSDSVRRPGSEELRSNPRSAPAKLRWAVRSAQ